MYVFFRNNAFLSHVPAFQVRGEEDFITNLDVIKRWKERDVTAHRNYLFATTDDDLRDTMYFNNRYRDVRKNKNQHAQTEADNRLILLQQFTEYKFKLNHNVTSRR